MVSRASIILQHTNFMVLYDKGYHTASEIAACHQLGVETLVAIPARPVSSQSPNPAFNFESFTYNQTTDTYTCPAGKELKTNGTVYTSKSSDFKQYKTSQCKQCPLKSECTTSSKNGRVIQRSAHIENTERNKNMIEKYKEIYKKRQAIVEHPFGTIKRQWGFDHTIMKRGIEKVSSDIGLIFLSYNLRRLMNILSKMNKEGNSHFKNQYFKAILAYFKQLKKWAFNFPDPFLTSLHGNYLRIFSHEKMFFCYF